MGVWTSLNQAAGSWEGPPEGNGLQMVRHGMFPGCFSISKERPGGHGTFRPSPSSPQV